MKHLIVLLLSACVLGCASTKLPDVSCPSTTLTSRAAFQGSLEAGVLLTGAGLGAWMYHAETRGRVEGACPNNICDNRRFTQEDLNTLQQTWDGSMALAIGLSATGIAGLFIGAVGLKLTPCAR